jgi:hypothetical protein
VYAVRGDTRSSKVEISATPAILQNGSFEMPTVQAEQYAPADAGWTFTPAKGHIGSGIAANTGVFMQKHTPTPFGTQVAFLQGEATIGKTIRGLSPGVTYRLDFRAAQRATYNTAGQTWQVRWGDQLVGTFGPPRSTPTWADYTLHVTATAAEQTLTFAGTNEHGGDNTVLLDDIRLVPESDK